MKHGYKGSDEPNNEVAAETALCAEIEALGWKCTRQVIGRWPCGGREMLKTIRCDIYLTPPRAWRHFLRLPRIVVEVKDADQSTPVRQGIAQAASYIAAFDWQDPDDKQRPVWRQHPSAPLLRPALALVATPMTLDERNWEWGSTPTATPHIEAERGAWRSGVAFLRRSPRDGLGFIWNDQKFWLSDVSA